MTTFSVKPLNAVARKMNRVEYERKFSEYISLLKRQGIASIRLEGGANLIEPLKDLELFQKMQELLMVFWVPIPLTTSLKLF